MGKEYWKHPEYAEWITRQECVDCGGFTGEDKYNVWRCDASHVKSKGSGGGEYNNLIPQCRACHIKFESQSKYKKREYLKLAQDFYKMYCDAHLELIDEELISWPVN